MLLMILTKNKLKQIYTVIVLKRVDFIINQLINNFFQYLLEVLLGSSLSSQTSYLLYGLVLAI